MIEISQVTKSFDGQIVFKDIDLTINDGELFVLLGESGAGKSVLLKHMMGLIKPDKGTICINGENIVALAERQLLRVRKNIGYLFQEGALYDFMSVYENVAFPLVEHTSLSKKDVRDKVLNTLELVDLKGVELKFPSELSGGMKKRVGLARAIILDSQLLFCDEPTSGLDPIRSRDISDLIKDISQKLKCTTVITSHDIDNSLRIADRLALIRDAGIVAMGTAQELKASSDAFVKEFILK